MVIAEQISFLHFQLRDLHDQSPRRRRRACFYPQSIAEEFHTVFSCVGKGSTGKNIPMALLK